ncbi:hypothetical protein Glove_84g47 [Diversispora epigaea]|uniref:Uncharacterized protein n=1 Tax=Diversispora epigaea TaxID=1348612 RepID=A0A397JAX3_9GLOM|nr:hypothetical protein Glove_84g47 [Diversispora epigaea]
MVEVTSQRRPSAGLGDYRIRQSRRNPSKGSTCKYSPEDTTCMDFITDADGGDEALAFALCLDDGFIKDFDNDKRDGIFCKTYNVKITNGIATLSINIYDATSKPAKVQSINISMDGQFGTRYNINNYSRIVNSEDEETVKVRGDWYPYHFVWHV